MTFLLPEDLYDRIRNTNLIDTSDPQVRAGVALHCASVAAGLFLQAWLTYDPAGTLWLGFIIAGVLTGWLVIVAYRAEPLLFNVLNYMSYVGGVGLYIFFGVVMPGEFAGDRQILYLLGGVVLLIVNTYVPYTRLSIALGGVTVVAFALVIAHDAVAALAAGHSQPLSLGQSTTMIMMGLVLTSQIMTRSAYERSIKRLSEARARIAALEDRAQLATENERMRDQLARINRIAVVEALTTSLAHELNQPLGSALTFTQAARRWLERPESDPAEALEAIRGAAAQIETLGKIMASIRRYTTRNRREPELHDLGDIVQRLITLLESELRARSVELRLDLPSRPEERFALVQEEEVGQVVLNLITNSIEAFSPEQKDKRLEVFLRTESSDWLLLGVSDNAGGIPPEVEDRIFEGFITTKEKGSGLGLSICRAIAENHGGTILVSSAPGKGTTAAMRLPLHRLPG